ncbi:MAG: T9SS type A sorting domain-containing protein, partial [Crocinitomicaceae bacterium]|nr:T9SS type A sorting domain-containing protein [Crocinitomicaceae bacterium]
VGGDCGTPNSQGASLVMGYTPGSSPMTLPAASPLKLGITMPANSQIIFAMHYPEGSYGEYDSTKVIFHFYPPGETGVRQVTTSPILQNWNFELPSEQFTTVSAQYPASGGLPTAYSMLSVFPHMHLLGQEMKVYGIQPNLDTLQLIDIPDWDFEWQDFYFFKTIQKAEAGATFKVDAVYNNTSGNIHNPNNPPITVYAGLNTSDEMCLVYTHFMPYLPGDENYNLDSLMNLSTSSLIEENFGPTPIKVYPNPFNEGVHIYSKAATAGDQVSVFIYNTQGKIVRKLLNKEVLQTKELDIEWDGKNDDRQATTAGLYFISININGTLSQHRLIKN